MNYDYQWEYLHDNQTPTKKLSEWQSRFGPVVTDRDSKGNCKKVKFQLLIDNKNIDAYIIGSFNNWENDIEKLSDYKLKTDEHGNFGEIVLDGISHKEEYKYLIFDRKAGKKMIIEDPAASYFTDEGNSVFWDFEDSSCYKLKFPLINNFNRSTKIMQTDLPGLISHFANKEGVCGKDVKQKDYYKFICESGVIEEIKKLGFNAIQFLPFAQSIDGDNWKLRYLVPFQFAIQKNWGNPDDFAQMIDEFHKQEICVIGDFVLGHLPDRDFQIFGQSFKEHGIHIWKKADSTDLYLKDETSWGTKRIDFDNSLVREFFISSVIHFMKHYRIDGFRIDNVDGIIRYGDNGDGDERENGRTFLRELNSTIYAYNPCALVHFEAHYYYEDNAKMLVAPLNSDSRALGATAYNSSRITYYFHTKYMFLASDENSIWKIKHIMDEKEWGKSNSTVADFHNHDAAAGLMDMRCTGSYAYDSLLAINPHNHVHAIGKIKVMEAIISFGCEGRTLDLLQTFLLQSGTFEHDTSIWWHLTFNEINKAVVNYKRKVNSIMDDSAFWPSSVNNREYLNIDDKNKVIVIERSSKVEGKESNYVIVINFASWNLHSYRVGLKSNKDYKVVFNSDEMQYGGFGITNFGEKLENKKSRSFELLDREVEINTLPGYGVLVLKERD